MPIGELTNSLECLVTVFDLILNKAPVLTRLFLNTVDTYLTHHDRLAKTTRLTNAYPNTEGLAGASDAYVSLLEFMRACRSGAQLILYRHVSGVGWMTKWDSLKEQLHVCQSTIPKVVLDSAQRDILLKEGKELVTLQGDCWKLFKAWVTERLRTTPNGLRDVQLIFPALQERERNWDGILMNLKNKVYDRILCMPRLKIFHRDSSEV